MADVAVFPRPPSSFDNSVNALEFSQALIPRNAAKTASQSQSGKAGQTQISKSQKESLSRHVASQSSRPSLQKETGVLKSNRKRGWEDTHTDGGEESEEDDEAIEAQLLAERRAAGKKAKASAQPGAHSKNQRLTKHGSGGEEVYEVLMTAVCAQLVRTRQYPRIHSF